MGPEKSSISVPPIREMMSSLVLSRLKRARERRPLPLSGWQREHS